MVGSPGQEPQGEREQCNRIADLKGYKSFETEKNGALTHEKRGFERHMDKKNQKGEERAPDPVDEQDEIDPVSNQHYGQTVMHEEPRSQGLVPGIHDSHRGRTGDQENIEQKC